MFHSLTKKELARASDIIKQFKLGNRSVICPYCGDRIIRKFTKSTVLRTCSKCRKLKNWHEGKFRTRLTKIFSAESSIRGAQECFYSLRTINDKGMRVIFFMAKPFITFNFNDTITLSYPKIPKRGLWSTKWSGTYAENPAFIYNSRTNHWFKLLRSGEETMV